MNAEYNFKKIVSGVVPDVESHYLETLYTLVQEVAFEE